MTLINCLCNFQSGFECSLKHFSRTSNNEILSSHKVVKETPEVVLYVNQYCIHHLQLIRTHHAFIYTCLRNFQCQPRSSLKHFNKASNIKVSPHEVVKETLGNTLIDFYVNYHVYHPQPALQHFYWFNLHKISE